jgi:hypothetical protein
MMDSEHGCTDASPRPADAPPFELPKRSRRARCIYVLGAISLCATIFLVPLHFVPSSGRASLTVIYLFGVIYLVGLLVAVFTGWYAIVAAAINLIWRRKRTCPEDKRMIWGGLAMGLGGGLPATAVVVWWAGLIYMLYTYPID